MVAILPKGAFTPLPEIVLLGRPADGQLKQCGNLVLISPVSDNEVNTVGGDRVVQDLNCEASSGLKQPVQIALTGTCEFEQELSLVTTVSDMPDVTWQKIPIGSWYAPS